FVLEELNKITNKRIKDFILEPIVLGSGISPKDFDEAGDCGYVGMSNIKNWCLDKESVMSVSKKFEAENKKKTIAKNDILIARSGEGTIGKCALIEDDEPNAIFADFTMRVRLKNYNQRFAYYFFRTAYFQVLIEINKKGLGNNTNIFPSQIREFPIIDISLTRQQKIVDEIKLELDLQEQIKKQIEAERQKIDVIIEQSISS
ncbi:MAG: restriction endonuclease subunit S, partial [Rickettsiales bacterium]|nr:restriction endonuclease subunit S [Rickettsiales bacterium]